MEDVPKLVDVVVSVEPLPPDSSAHSIPVPVDFNTCPFVPVPPLAVKVPVITKLEIVPSVVIFDDPDQVDNAVFSTLFNDKSDFNSLNVLPFTWLVPINNISLVVNNSSVCKAFPLDLPNVKASCLLFQVDADDILLSAIEVPCHTPDVIVPSVVIFDEPDQVDNAVFSTLFNDKSDFNSLYVLPFTWLVPINNISFVANNSSDCKALPLNLPNVIIFCLFPILLDKVFNWVCILEDVPLKLANSLGINITPPVVNSSIWILLHTKSALL